MLNAAYESSVLCLPGCGVMMDGQDRFMWRGPRIRMGICQDVPQAIMPHPTSGRADYFGGFVNRFDMLVSPRAACSGACAYLSSFWKVGDEHVLRPTYHYQAALRTTSG